MTVSAVDVIEVALAEVGYHEGRSGGHWNNYQRYSPAVPGLEWSQNQAWCATFVSWCALKAGAASLYPRTASCATAVAWFKSRKRFSEYPAIGAQVFYGPGGGSHTGIVYDYDGTYIYTVEGNTNTSGSAEGDGVYKKRRVRRDSYVYGYGYPDFADGIKSADPAWAHPVTTPTVDLSNLVAAARTDPGAAQGHQTHAADVRLVEAALRAEGLLSAAYAGDGSFGSTTVTAYAAWQRKLGYRGTAADGIPGSVSLKALGDKHGFRVAA